MENSQRKINFEFSHFLISHIYPLRFFKNASDLAVAFCDIGNWNQLKRRPLSFADRLPVVTNNHVTLDIFLASRGDRIFVCSTAGSDA